VERSPPAQPPLLADSLAEAAHVLTGRSDGVVLLDIETTGLAGSPLFLIGLLSVEGGRLNLCQLFADRPAEEAWVLEGFFRKVDGFALLVTFNGARFDVPYLQERAAVHGIPRIALPPNLDLLPHARRRWQGALPDFRLTTLEAAICGRTRAGDVPGSEIPGRYAEFLRTGDRELIAPILEHNAQDLLTTAELLPYLLDATERIRR
jgi:hypothetical protein